jgi:hypothetical protein
MSALRQGRAWVRRRKLLRGMKTWHSVAPALLSPTDETQDEHRARCDYPNERTTNSWS